MKRLNSKRIAPDLEIDSVEWPLIVNDRSSGASQETSVLEIYKEYLKTASDWDKAAVSSERFFSTINLAILSGYMFIVKEKLDLPLTVLLAMLVASLWFAVMWIVTNMSYAKAVTSKMEVAQEIEELLPLRPLKYEWEEKLKKNRYIRISRIQRIFPVIFIVLYIALAVSLLKLR